MEVLWLRQPALPIGSPSGCGREVIREQHRHGPLHCKGWRHRPIKVTLRAGEWSKRHLTRDFFYFEREREESVKEREEEEEEEEEHAQEEEEEEEKVRGDDGGFQYWHGSEVVIQMLQAEQLQETEDVLVDSFAELMGGGLLAYRPLLALTVRQYLRERLQAFPNSVTLVALYAHDQLLVGTVEVCFQVAGHPYVASPLLPPDSPYLCNMAVKRAYRRRGLGRQLLKAAEKLVVDRGCHDLYLHCRLVDTAPLKMYKEANYQIVATDGLLHLLKLQRRRHLMRKILCAPEPVSDTPDAHTSFAHHTS